MFDLERVLDLGKVPAADHFPLGDDLPTYDESVHPLAMDLCLTCGLAQLAEDDTIVEESRGIEPEALRDQAACAVARVARSGLLRGSRVREFGSPHGGTWIQLLVERGLYASDGPCDVVLDSFGLMHEPDQSTAFARRAAVTAPGGVLLIQYHSLATIVSRGQWNALRHGHFAYYSATALARLLDDVGMCPVRAWTFDLYGGTVLIAAVHGRVRPDETVQRILVDETGMTDPRTVGKLQRVANDHVRALRTWLEVESRLGKRVYAYGAASRAVALFSLAGVDRHLVAAVADASPAKQGRRMPGTNVPIIAPEQLVAADPDRVLLTLPDLLPEVSRRYPALGGRWTTELS